MFVHKKLPAVIIVLILVIAGLAAIFHFGSKDRNYEEVEEDVDVADVADDVPEKETVPEFTQEDYDVPKEVPPLLLDEKEEAVIDDPEADRIKQVARVFVELWGSYSQANDFENFDDAVYFATDDMADVLRAKKFELKGSDDSEQTVSSALTAKLVERSDGNARLEVLAMRTVSIGGTDESYRQRAFVDMVLVGDAWLVSGASWSEKTF